MASVLLGIVTVGLQQSAMVILHNDQVAPRYIMGNRARHAANYEKALERVYQFGMKWLARFRVFT